MLFMHANKRTLNLMNEARHLNELNFSKQIQNGGVVIHKKYVESKAEIIKERRNATQNIASVILISVIFVL